MSEEVYFGLDENGKVFVIDKDKVDWQYKCGCKESEHNQADYCPVHDEPSYRLDYPD